MGQQNNPEDLEIIKLHIEDNLYQLYRFIANTGGRKVFEGESVNWVNTSPSAWPNMIFNTSGTNPDPQEIISVLESVRQKEAPPFWIIESSNTEMIRILETGGMIPVDLLPGMAMDICSYQSVSAPSVTDLVITDTDSGDQLEDFLNIVNACIFKGKELDRSLFSLLTGLPEIHFYLGYLKGVPASTSMSFYNENTAGFYNIATLPEFRKMGLGQALTAHAMQKAASDGMKFGVLHATRMGEPLYQKMGFSHCNELIVYWMKGKEYRDY
jgi:GNAT superfamily N-acetyltransferase